MKKTKQRAQSACSDSLRVKGQGSGVRDQGSGRRSIRTGARCAIAFWIVAAILFLLSACGVKGPPQPRELVVPEPVKDVAVTVLPEGIRITFTLPSKNLDGSSLEMIGGYRILREGPDGKDVREDLRFSVSEMRQRVGKSVAFLDQPPSMTGTYRYCVVAFDAYGTYPGKRRTAEFCWEGTLSGKGNE